MYIERQLEKEIKPFLDKKEAISIIGPRQAGKTTFIEHLAKGFEKTGKKVKFATFENRDDLNLFNNDIESFKKIAEQYAVVIIDEFQYSRDGGQKLKYLYDTTKVKFIVSGSSSLELTFQTGKYMVGRLHEFTLMPFSFREFLSARDPEIYRLLKDKIADNPLEAEAKDYFGAEINGRLVKSFEHYAVFGGYPAVVLSDSDEERKKTLESIYNKFLLKDIKDLLRLATDQELEKLGKLLAGQAGNIIKYRELSSASGLAHKELKKHLSILEKTCIISLARPFFTNKRTELVKNPKVYFNDAGMRNYALADFRPAETRTDTGSLAENCAHNLLRSVSGHNMKYWRTKAGAEVDFVVEREQSVFPVEIKYTSRRVVGKSLYSFIDKFSPPAAVILTRDYSGEEKIGGVKIKFLPIIYF